MRLSTAVDIAQIVSTLVLALALLLTALQLRQIQLQNSIARQGEMARGTIELIRYLTTDTIKTATHHCDLAGKKPFQKWTNEDRAAVTTVINAFDVAGIMIRSHFCRRKINCR